MAWKCQNCGWNNFKDSWVKCEHCGSWNSTLTSAITERKERQEQEERAILEKENRIANFMVTTTQYLDGNEIKEYFGIVSAVIVLGTGLLADLGAGFADFLGTRAHGYQNKIDKATEAVMKQIIDKAINRSRKINAVVGLKLDYTVTGGNMMMLVATGTAVWYEPILE